jgi:outer membrane lipoprotein SlyB
MEPTMDSLATKTQRLHPLLAAAAVSVIAVSALGAAALVNSQVFARHTDLAPAAMTTPAAVVAAAVPETLPAAPAVATPPVPPAVVNRPVAKLPPKQKTLPADMPAPIAQAPAVSPPAVTTPVEAVPTPRSVAPPVLAPVCHDCGTVIGVREIKDPGQASGLGAVAGGVLGAVLGNQVGEGQGKKIARVLGGVGGAVAGHQVEKQTRSSVHYMVDVRMEDGTTQSVRRDAPPSVQAGNRVRVQGGQLLSMDGGAVAS